MSRDVFTETSSDRRIESSGPTTKKKNTFFVCVFPYVGGSMLRAEDTASPPAKSNKQSILKQSETYKSMISLGVK